VVHYGQSDRLVHFGLGPRTAADEIRVRWPDGSEDVLRDVAGDRVIELEQGAAR
jgi:hypothetical protein